MAAFLISSFKRNQVLRRAENGNAGAEVMESIIRTAGNEKKLLFIFSMAIVLLEA